MIARRHAVEQCRKTILWVARTAESLCNLVDLPELAERLRPALARASRPLPEEPQPPPDSEPDDDVEPDVDVEPKDDVEPEDDPGQTA